MQLWKRAALLFAVGGFVGDVFAMALGPRAIAWFQTPAVGQALCECARVTEETGTAIVKLQLAAMGGGGGLFVVVGLLGSFLWKRRQHNAGLDLVRAGSSSPPAP